MYREYELSFILTSAKLTKCFVTFGKITENIIAKHLTFFILKHYKISMYVHYNLGRML
jgi:hypothetical protein